MIDQLSLWLKYQQKLMSTVQARSGGVDWFDRTPLSRQQYMYTCNCCGPTSKLPNISVKIYNGICTKMSHFK